MYQEFLDFIFPLAEGAGKIQLAYFRGDDLAIRTKSNVYDVVTRADKESEAYIAAAILERWPDHEILGEEGGSMGRAGSDYRWVVDPLDGTLEFLKGNNEFTVNIALMENNRCRGAAIYVPYFGRMYYAGRGEGAWVCEGITPDASADYTYGRIVAAGRLPSQTKARDVLRVAVSRSHRTPETDAHIEALRRRVGAVEVVEQGSSYKFCMLAEGIADYYVRTSDTCEWDTAAGELILAEAGGSTRSLADGAALRYNKEDLRNPWFVCRSRDCGV